MPMTEPPENATPSARFRPVRAAAAVRTLASVATRMPKKPASAEQTAPDHEGDADQPRAVSAGREVGPGEQPGDDDDEDREHPVLAAEERHRAFADVAAEAHHGLVAGVLAADPVAAHEAIQQGGDAAHGRRDTRTPSIAPSSLLTRWPADIAGLGSSVESTHGHLDSLDQPALTRIRRPRTICSTLSRCSGANGPSTNSTCSFAGGWPPPRGSRAAAAAPSSVRRPRLSTPSRGARPGFRRPAAAGLPRGRPGRRDDQHARRFDAAPFHKAVTA